MKFNRKSRILTRLTNHIILALMCFGLFAWQIASAAAPEKLNFSTNLQPEIDAEGNKLGGTNDLQIFAEFNQWIERHVNRDFPNEEEHLRRGASLAAKRRKAMTDLIQINPETALN